ncbi:Ger(x)C family spore germination protein [Bacillus sp. CGMCC 1.16607]|uniref:Ger(x)C family spore germination protein n=1 Tax=Bacillus sp. CGMCC 1.16607 TaxID=3351842 RepID=UPI0036394E38
MKKIFLVIILCILTLLLSSCWDRFEINDMAIVTAAAIDLTEDNRVKLSVQVFIPRTIGGGGEVSGGGESSTLVRTGTGMNLADAVSKLQMKLPRKIFWGQCKVFIFGMDMAKMGIQKQLDFLLRHPQPRERANMFVSRDDAEKVIQLLPPLEKYSGEVLRKLADLKIGLKVSMKDLDIMLTNEAQATGLPLIEILPPEKGNKETETIPYIKGSAVFKEDKMIGIIDERITRGILWLKNEMKEYTVSFKPKNENGEISLNPVKADVKLVPTIEKGQWNMFVKVRTEGDIVQNETKLIVMDVKVIKRLEADFEKNIQSRIEETVKLLQEKFNADIIGFATEYHRHFPKEWQKAKDNWDVLFPKINVKVDVEAIIKRPGYINEPSGLPEGKVEKD